MKGFKLRDDGMGLFNFFMIVVGRGGCKFDLLDGLEAIESVYLFTGVAVLLFFFDVAENDLAQLGPAVLLGRRVVLQLDLNASVVQLDDVRT
jgi:hypothetical protein